MRKAIGNSLLLVVNRDAGDLLARRISSTHSNRAALAISRDGSLTRHRNFAIFLDGQFVGSVVDLLDRPRV